MMKTTTNWWVLDMDMFGRTTGLGWDLNTLTMPGEFPCSCCPFGKAFNCDTAQWTCAPMVKTWQFVQEKPHPMAPHPVGLCPGGCKTHFLLHPRMAKGEHWLDIAYDEEMAELAAMSPAQVAAAVAAKAQDRAMQEIEAEVVKMQVYAVNVRDRVMTGKQRGKAVEKRSQPCKWVVGEFHGETCWAHEFFNKKTGLWEKPHTCDRIHPGEAGWHDEWFKDPRWKSPEAKAAQAAMANQRVAAPPLKAGKIWQVARGSSGKDAW